MILAERRITILCEFIISIGLRLAKADNHIAIAVVPALPAFKELIIISDTLYRLLPLQLNWLQFYFPCSIVFSLLVLMKLTKRRKAIWNKLVVPLWFRLTFADNHLPVVVDTALPALQPLVLLSYEFNRNEIVLGWVFYFKLHGSCKFSNLVLVLHAQRREPILSVIIISIGLWTTDANRHLAFVIHPTLPTF